ncbi:MAG: ABC transporter ATP-binding protein [Planctomycetota bacterium]
MTAPALEIQSLKFRYARQSDWVVDMPSLTLSRGEQLLLSAPSGRGKSTLLHLVCGLMEPKEGRVLVNGQAIHDLRGAARDRFRGRSIGVIFQNFNLLHGFTARENVMAALLFSGIPTREHKKRATEMLAHLGIDTPRRQTDRMSIGQQQRVAVARAMACDPVLVLADEPTASLDPENAAVAMDLIQRSCREREAALLCVSHDPALDERFERRETL